MRIHTSATRADIMRATLDAGAWLDTCDEHASRTHARAFEVKLRGSSRRRPNFYSGDDSYAATWDQWGIFLAAIFDADPDARMGGTLKRPAYADRWDFHRKTFGRFEGGIPDDMHGDHTFRYDGTPYVQHCTRCSAEYTWAV